MKDISEQFSNYKSSYIGKASSLFLGDKPFVNYTSVAPGLPVLLEREVNETVVVEGRIDTSLIKTYNDLQQTNFPLFPVNAFEPGNNGRIKLAPNMLQSADSLKVFLKDATGLRNNTVYLIPVRLTVSSGTARLKSSVLFLKMQLIVSDLKGKMNAFVSSPNFNVTSSWRVNYIAGTVNNLRLNGVNDGPEAISFSVRLLDTVPKEVRGGIQENTSDSIFIWYSKNIANAPLKRIPQDAFKITQKNVSIPSKGFVSSDNFSVQINYDMLAPSDTAYLLILEMENTSDKSLITPDTEGNGHRAFIQVYMREIITGNVAISNDGLSGSMMNRRNWSSTSSGGASDEEFPAANVLDGSVETYWRGANAGPQDLIIDMGKVRTLKGFFLTPQYKSIYEGFNNMKIYSSNDGKSWIYQGMYQGTNTDWQSSITNPDIKTLRFLNPVSSRYIKFGLMNAYGNPAIAEINGVE
ncbi:MULTISPECIES: BT_3987 domain-containing protein [unclassified Sphingobacterium]|uniref:BT_3987 domain-containing protein n=1 Tax=unclassified Sphingobacterium TaxID=2609468 RepID=UPI0025FCF2AF|nr:MULTISPECIES: DUF1735 domain-containing protein [unclassified Sphingobacterium]